MLTFNPEKRITLNQVLEHPYLIQLSRQGTAPECRELFNFEFEKKYIESGTVIPKAILRELMYGEKEFYEAEDNEMACDEND